jgi:16S rRNA processing protein RimM
LTHDNKVCVARIGAPHGVRGDVALWSFTEDPMAVTAYGPLRSQDGSRVLEIASARAAKDKLIVHFKSIDTREAAEALNGAELYVAREKLPATDDDEFYHADLIGLAAVLDTDEPYGAVTAIHNFGAGDIIEIATRNGAQMLPFTKAVVPVIDLATRRIVVAPPDEIIGDGPDASAGA